ncbi:hypothetical protein, partial [Leptodesmis sp.]|uniref:hypothetical protein n=1 Tax=Leptodesmis sp. TaxID=3100501 RepID=UPI0040534A1D
MLHDVDRSSQVDRLHGSQLDECCPNSKQGDRSPRFCIGIEESGSNSHEELLKYNRLQHEANSMSDRIARIYNSFD